MIRSRQQGFFLSFALLITISTMLTGCQSASDLPLEESYVTGCIIATKTWLVNEDSFKLISPLEDIMETGLMKYSATDASGKILQRIMDCRTMDDQEYHD